MDKVVGLLRAVGVEAGEFLLERLDKGVLDVLVQEQVVRGDAGLAAVEALAPSDAAGGDGQVRVLVDNARALAAEFEDHRRQVLGLRLHSDPAEGRASGQEDEVVAMLE